MRLSSLVWCEIFVTCTHFTLREDCSMQIQ
jgi:hypothetical protein